MRKKWLAPLGAVLMLAASGGACLAQQDDASFYSVPAWPDPVLAKVHVLPPSVATADIAAVSPEAGAAKMSRPSHTACDTLNPCALTPTVHS